MFKIIRRWALKRMIHHIILSGLFLLILFYITQIIDLKKESIFTFYIIYTMIFINFSYIILWFLIFTFKLYMIPINKYTKYKNYNIHDEILELEFQNSIHLENIRIGKKYLFYFIYNKINILDTQDILWIYKKESIPKPYGMKTGITYQINIITKNQKKIKLNFHKGKNLQKAFLLLIQSNPTMLLGYKKELDIMFHKNFNALLKYQEEHSVSQKISSSNEKID